MSLSHRVLTAVCGLFAAASLLTGCLTIEPLRDESARLRPGDGEYLRVDQIMILVDVTGSTGEHHIFPDEKELVKAFTKIMPDMNYEMGINTFAGIDAADWTRVPLRQGNPIILNATANHLEFLGGLTPLEMAVRFTGAEFNGTTGLAALVVFSDGRKQPHEPILQACRDVAQNHNGPLCIFTINVGYGEEGRVLLENMSQQTGCGRAWQANEVNTPEGMEEMVRTIFFGRYPDQQSSIMEPSVTLSGDVLFDLDKSTLRPEGKAAVDVLVNRMKNRPGEKVVVEGHTCDRGREAYNMDLSQRRANAVQTYMIEQGIDTARIGTQAFGESQLEVSNTDEASRKLNRRAEFKFSGAN
ncbi:MAG: OmpA family protein [Candidatus Hydrogenedentes bacterium]|nr:OmpA family protein [Candidatus Hydrogenedentota bacterium]